MANEINTKKIKILTLFLSFKILCQSSFFKVRNNNRTQSIDIPKEYHLFLK